MADMFSILSANYKAVGLTVPSKAPYVVVDPVLYQGNWTGNTPTTNGSRSRSRT